MEGRGESLRIALLRAFVRHAFGESVDDDFLRRPQTLLGARADGDRRAERGCRPDGDRRYSAGAGRTHRRYRLRATAVSERMRKTKRAFRMEGPSKVVRLAGFEPTTPWFVAKYSIQLSYSRTQNRYCFVDSLRLWLNAFN